MKMSRCTALILALSVSLCSQLFSQDSPPNQQAPRKTAMNPEVKKGIELFKKQKYQDAEKIFLEVLNSEPKNLIAREMLAGIYYHTGNPDQARKYALLSAHQSKRSGYPYLVMAWLAAGKGKMLAARDFLAKAERLAKTDLVKEEIKKFKKEHAEQFQTKLPANQSAAVKLAVGDQKLYLAVFQFEDNSEEPDSTLAGTISEMMVTALAQSNRYRLMERTQLDKVLEEQALGQSGALEQQTAAEVGKLAGVNMVLVGSIGKLDDRFELDARLIEAASGEIRQAGSSSAKGENKLREAVNELAQKLTGN